MAFCRFYLFSRSFLGFCRSFLGFCRSFLSFSRSFLGFCRCFLGFCRSFLSVWLSITNNDSDTFHRCRNNNVLCTYVYEGRSSFAILLMVIGFSIIYSVNTVFDILVEFNCKFCYREIIGLCTEECSSILCCTIALTGQIVHPNPEQYFRTCVSISPCPFRAVNVCDRACIVSICAFS